MNYTVKRAEQPPTIDANWTKAPWAETDLLELNYLLRPDVEHRPNTQAKLLYDNDCVYVIFRVEDRYVRAVSSKNHDDVCHDSCVEFFFTPGMDIQKGYFNIEINCGCVMLFHYQEKPGADVRTLCDADCERVERVSSMPRIVEPEIAEPTTWTLEYRVPIDILEGFMQVDRAAPGVSWRAGLYKCADMTSHPHWLAWTDVSSSTTGFHCPHLFGTITFQ